ncbi:MAG: WecB/TagA/CpsF family glycosyltransferase [Parafilimonas sp.]|nr:WecB/TagA/CpsF family glycosyltransferase [Parafilimonas sp.]
MEHRDTLKILGIDFINTSTQQVVNILKNGGLLVVPAAPALINIKKDPAYYSALQTADVVIPDSGYMALLWNFFHHNKIKRISGLEFLNSFFKDEDVKKTSALFLVDPRPTEAQHNLNYLKKSGFKIADDMSYLAPMYKKDKVEDPELLNIIEQKKPKYVIINLGGGTQEKLGAYLKNNLSYKPAIICTGAAIAFLTGQQASIPTWGDKLFLGWLFRCIQNPKLYVPRYFKAFQLAIFMFRYGQQQPL